MSYVLKKIEKQHFNMKFNFFFISYTVIYAKYNHCYEIPRDMPVRYFDGKEWKFMKPRHNLRTKAPRYTKLSTELDWADLIKEINDIELQESTTQMPPICRTKINTSTTEDTTTKTTTTKKTTIKKTTTRKITTKMTTPKITKRKTCLLTKPTTTKKPAVKHSTPRCKLKLKTTQTMTIDPRIWQMKTITNEVWINIWPRVTPTKKLCPVGESFSVNPSHCKLETTTTPTTIDPESWKKKMIASENWSIWTRVRPTMKPSTITAKKYPTKNVSVTSTKKCAATTKVPVTKTKEPVTATEEPDKVSGTRGDDGNGAENWSNLMKEFLKYVEAKKCGPPCEYGATPAMPFTGYKLGGKRLSSGADDLMNILMDGVEIDDKLDEVDEDTSQSAEIMRFKETYEADREQRLNFDAEEGFVSKDSKIDNDNEQDLDLQSFNDDEETAQSRKELALLKELKYKNDQDYETPRVSRSEAYLDELKVKNAIKEDEILQDSEINSYLDLLINRHTKKDKDSERTANLDAENAGHTGKAQDEDIRKSLDAIKDMNAQRYKDNSQYVSKDPLNFREPNRFADFVATKRTYSTDSTEIANDDEDFLQDRDITFDLGTLEGDHEKADKYSTKSIEIRDSDVYAYADAVHDINEQKDDETIKNYENVIPLFNFKYALNENISN